VDRQHVRCGKTAYIYRSNFVIRDKARLNSSLQRHASKLPEMEDSFHRAGQAILSQIDSIVPAASNRARAKFFFPIESRKIRAYIYIYILGIKETRSVSETKTEGAQRVPKRNSWLELAISATALKVDLKVDSVGDPYHIGINHHLSVTHQRYFRH